MPFKTHAMGEDLHSSSLPTDCVVSHRLEQVGKENSGGGKEGQTEAKAGCADDDEDVEIMIRRTTNKSREKKTQAGLAAIGRCNAAP